ncbi:MAG: hypothetical protein Q9M97_04785 [Candidatus Gracilibacteria bacterium]|nr:hypothetical protein [Candidatus Gracilibacteria bacterium]
MKKTCFRNSRTKIIFIYYIIVKVYPTYDEGGLAWGIHRTMIGNWVLRYLPIVQESLKKIMNKSLLRTGEEFNKKFCNNYEKNTFL